MNAKKKGNAGENKFANWLVANGIKAFRNSSSGANYNKSDIHNGLNANFEVKTVKRINLKEAWGQSTKDASMTHSTPYLVIHLDGMSDGEWLMVLHSNDWLDLVTKTEGIKTDYQDPKMKWALQGLKNAINSVMKFLPK